MSIRKIEITKRKNGTYAARMLFQNSRYLGEGDTEREAIADLVLAMGLLDEIKLLQSVAADADLHG